MYRDNSVDGRYAKVEGVGFLAALGGMLAPVVQAGTDRLAQAIGPKVKKQKVVAPPSAPTGLTSTQWAMLGGAAGLTVLLVVLMTRRRGR
jgi:hypothetical protein